MEIFIFIVISIVWSIIRYVINQHLEILIFIVTSIVWWVVPAAIISILLRRFSNKRPKWKSAQRCHLCSYFLGDLPTDICPECGHDHSNIRHHTWKHRALFELTGVTSLKPIGRLFRSVLRIGSALAVALIFLTLFAIAPWQIIPFHWLFAQGILVTGLVFGFPGGTAIVTLHGYFVARVANPPSQPIAPIRLVILLIITFFADGFVLGQLNISSLLY